jgi:hypothetical protein
MSSNVLTKLIWLLWIITILFAWWFIPPRIDDGIYLFPAISVLNGYPPSGFLDDLIYPIFYIFPTQPFLHGLFLKFISLFSFEISLNTYRLFNYLSVILLFYLVHRLFSTIFDNKIQSKSAANISLIFLGFSQFSVQFFVNRPEILALVFFLTGLISSVKFINKHKRSDIHIMIAFFSFGLSVVLHINFIMLSGSIILYLLWIMIIDSRVRYSKFLVIFFIPLLFFAIWFFANFEVAYDQLFSRINHEMREGVFKFSSVIDMLSVITGKGGNSAIHKAYLGVHMMTLLASLLSLLGFLFFSKRLYSPNKRIINLFLVLSISVVSLFILMEPWPAYYLLISFLTIILVVFYMTSLLLSNKIFLNFSEHLGKKLYFKVFVVFVILSLPFFHLLKIYIHDGNYFNHHKAIDILSSKAPNAGHIFINSPQLLPLYADAINKNFSNKVDKRKIKVHWYFPVPDSPSVKSQELMLQSIVNDTVEMQGAVWGTLKEYLSLRGNSGCLTLAAKKHYLKIDGVKVLYEDRDNIFFISNNVKLSTKSSCYE